MIFCWRRKLQITGHTYYQMLFFIIIIIISSRMLRFLSLITFRMAEIRPMRTALNQSPYKHKQIASFFGIPLQGTQSDEQITKNYLMLLAARKQFNNRLNQISYIDFLRKSSELKLFDFTKQQISKNYKQITPEAQSAINNFYSYSMKLYNQVMMGPTINPNHELWKDLCACLESINQFFILMTPQISYTMLYMTSVLRSHIKKNYSVPHEIVLTNYRYSIDFMTSLPLHNFDTITLMKIFKNMAEVNLNFFYHNRSYQVIKHFWNGIKDSWHLDTQNRRTVIYAMTTLNFYTDHILDRVENLLTAKQSNLRGFEKVHFLVTLIKFKRINSTNCQNKKYRELIASLVKEFHEINGIFFSKTINVFYMARIWLTQYWCPFLKFLQRDGDNTIVTYKIYVIERMFNLCKDEIPAQILAASSPLKQILSKNPHFQGQGLMRDFMQKQMDSNKTLSCQMQIANALRLVNVGSIRTEFLIEFFSVDILLNDNCVIEINGNSHYLNNIQTNKRDYDLKTSFRSNMLLKLGYQVVDVDLNDYSEGSFEVIKNIYQVAKKLKSSEPKPKWIHLSTTCQG